MTRDELLARYPPEVSELARTLHAFVRDLVPELEERVYAGWRGIGFHDPQAGYVFGIFPQQDSVRLLFEHGATLPDPDGELEGTGSRARFISLRPGEPLPREQLVRFIGQALRR